MIVISGALVLVAIVLLLIGIFAHSQAFVYASIAVSVVAFGFLGFGIFQRRGHAPDAELADEGTSGPATSPFQDTSDVTAVTRSALPTASAGSVLVVAGRPRYHVAGCRYLNGKDAGEIGVSQAEADGFTPCGVCKPDEAVASSGRAAVMEPTEARAGSLAQELTAPAVEAPIVEPTPATSRRGGAKTAAERAAVTKGDAPARTSLTKTAAGTAAAAPAKKALATKAPAAKAAGTGAKKAPATKVPATKTAGTGAKKAPVKASVTAMKAAAKKAPAKAAPAKKAAALGVGTVVVLPDADKFHRADCRYVRDADDAESLTRAQAARQGYRACGVCTP